MNPNLNLEDLDEWSSVPSGKLPCPSCGVSVAPVDNSVIEVLTIFGRVNPRPDVPVRNWDLPVARCEHCQLIFDAGTGLLNGHPDVRARIGSMSIAQHRMEGALSALDVLNTDAATLDRLTASTSDLRRLLESLTVVGASARWAAHAKDRSARPSATRWAHVTEEERREIRHAAAGLLARRIEKPVPFACPSDTGLPGCLLCGVAQVLELPSVEVAKRGVWIEMSADRASIGGRMHSEMVDGYVCEVCDRAIDAAHAVGQTAMSIAVRAFLGIPMHVRVLESIDGLIGWAALPQGTPPNALPWDHIDLDEVRKQANAILGYRPLTPVGSR